MVLLALSEICPPIILGSATFNNQYNTNASELPINKIIHTALSSGIRAFDTSPYYGPSEILLGAALTAPGIKDSFPRSTYLISTKAGRINANEFNYAPIWVRESVLRSCKRLGTDYIDIVFMHDIEFVSPSEMLTAVRELRKLRDEGRIRYVGVSGYPVPVLVEAAELVFQESGQGLDVVQSYGNYTIQNQILGVSRWMDRFIAAGVDVVWNASLLGMGLLRSKGVPIGGMGDWHPAPPGLRESIRSVVRLVEGKGLTIEDAALQWALEAWTMRGSVCGGKLGLGISVLGVSSVEELQHSLEVWRRICDANNLEQHSGNARPSHHIVVKSDLDSLMPQIRGLLGEWTDYAWPSPGDGWVNQYQTK